jgi:hypothetical protein
MVQARSTFNIGVEPRLFERCLLRFKGLDDLGRQGWKLADIEGF